MPLESWMRFGYCIASKHLEVIYRFRILLHSKTSFSRTLLSDAFLLLCSTILFYYYVLVFCSIILFYYFMFYYFVLLLCSTTMFYYFVLLLCSNILFYYFCSTILFSTIIFYYYFCSIIFVLIITFGSQLIKMLKIINNC